MLISTHFIVVAPPRIGEVVHNVLGSVVFKQLTTERAAILWAKGLENLVITPAGALHHFKDKPVEQLVQLLARCKDEDECLAIAQLNKSATMREALRQRLNQIAPAKAQATPVQAEVPRAGAAVVPPAQEAPAAAPIEELHTTTEEPRPRRGYNKRRSATTEGSHNPGPDEGAE